MSVKILGFRTLSIVLAFRKQTKETRRFGNCISFRPQVKENPILLGPLERASLNHWTTDVTNHMSYKHLRPG
jgi:hypothetical protein